MNPFTLYAVCIVSALTFAACSWKDPTIQITNLKATSASVLFKESRGGQFYIVAFGSSTTQPQSISSGEYEVRARLTDLDQPVTGFRAETNKRYLLTIRNTNPATVQIEISDR
jgi:hypothetical protein